jgi:hypothetical protein
MKFATILLTILGAGFPFSPAAEAAAVTNLAHEAQTIEIETADGYKALSIEAGRTYRTLGAIRVRYQKSYTIYIERNEEFAIWPNGNFGPQKIHDIKRNM